MAIPAAEDISRERIAAVIALVASSRPLPSMLDTVVVVAKVVHQVLHIASALPLGDLLAAREQSLLFELDAAAVLPAHAAEVAELR